ncbi:GDSL-type esterase/lipase family protein [Paenibacillus hexagrammi]|uniref:GDSL-type esterase/lipase family protein n=1 Tax=Paenibacillus hexagrammi TaxID=2908839 RepID=A0ABY3SRS4_9BACL|nr:GDSL-type esterase/lipase family protein [Paenibacillus sp. YPD9-1]UJF36105.1 GDSL-type esterase/lipase family protein [Paenibacillus sp. YPD9-1]
MKSTKWIWGMVGITGTLATIVFIIGFLYAVNQILYPKPGNSELAVSSPQPSQAPLGEGKDKIQIVALGDSLTAGTGDNTGKGYVDRVREKLEQQTGKAVFVLNNLAIPGYKSDQLLKDIELKKTQDALSDADVILLTIGGNDLFAGGEGIFSEDQQEFNPEAAQQRMEPALGRLETILADIRKANSHAVVLYVGLYHPF